MNAVISRLSPVLCLIFFLQSFCASAQELDLSFNPTITGVAGLQIFRAESQPDGKVVVAGQFVTVNGSSAPGFARINSDGTLDQTFQTGTGFNGTVYGIARQADGKFIIVGQFTSYNNQPVANVVRLNTNGTIDPTFNTGAGLDNYAMAIELQQDGKILIAGLFKKYNNITGNNIIRLNTDGSLDNTFSSGSGTGDFLIHDVAVQRDGKIVIGGSFNTYNGQSKSRLVRLESNGTLDATFNPSGVGPSDLVTCVSIQIVNSEDRIVFGGVFNKYNDVTIGRVARLKTDGSLDTSFQLAGVESKVVRDVYTFFDEVFVATNSDFTKHSSTGVATTLAYSGVFCLKSHGADKILVGGLFRKIKDVGRTSLAVIETSGTPVTTFNPVLANTALVTSLVELSNGKFLIGGDFNNLNGNAVGNIARLNADGSFDNTFNVGTGFSSTTSPAVDNIVLQSDGKILVGGWFRGFNDVSSNELSSLARLNNDGTIDPTFEKTFYLGGPARYLVSLPNNKILIGTSSNEVIRFNANGSIDNTFNGGAPVKLTGGEFGGMLVLSDGRVVVAHSSATETALKILLDNGTLGSTLATIPGIVKRMIANADKIYLSTGGNSSGTSSRIFRVDNNGGIVDTNVALAPSVSFDLGSVYAMAVINNTLLAGGYFQKSVFGSPSKQYDQPYLAAYDANGNFLPGVTATLDARITNLFAVSQGRVFAAGDFTAVNGVPKRNFAMLKLPASAPAAPSSVLGEFIGKTKVDLSWADNSNTETVFEIQRASKGSNEYTVLHLAKANETSWEDAITDTNPKGYTYRIRALNPSGASAFAESQLITGVEELFSGTQSLYPNPTSGIVRFDAGVHPETVVSVMDLRGQLKFTSLANESVDLSFLPAGIYFVKLWHNGVRVTTRLVKTN